jgi:hypothetical protein
MVVVVGRVHKTVESSFHVVVKMPLFLKPKSKIVDLDDFLQRKFDEVENQSSE